MSYVFTFKKNPVFGQNKVRANIFYYIKNSDLKTEKDGERYKSVSHLPLGGGDGTRTRNRLIDYNLNYLIVK